MPEQKSTFNAWLVVLSSALFALFSFINMNSFDAINQDLRQCFHADALQISTLSAMYFYANVIFLIPTGLLLDRFSTRRLIILAMPLSIIATFIFAFSQSLLLASFSRFIIGWASTFCLLGSFQLASRWFPPRKQAFVMGLVVTIAMLGGLGVQYISSLAYDLGSWRYAMVAVAGLGILFYIIVFLFVRDYPKTHQHEHAREQIHLHDLGFWRSFGQALLNKQTWLAGLYTNLLTLPMIVLGALWGKDYLVTVKHLSGSTAEDVASMIFLGLIIGSPVFGWWSDKWLRRKAPMIIGAIMTLLVLIFIRYTTLNHIWVLLIAFLLFGFFSAAQVITYPLIVESAPRHITASSEGLGAVIIMAAGAIFQPLFGWVMEKSSHYNGIYTADAYHNAMFILLIAFIASIVISLFIKETHARQIA